jgi:hypothetical protein
MNTAIARSAARSHRPFGALVVVAAIGAAALLALAADRWSLTTDAREVPAAPPVLPTSAQQQPDAHDIARWTSSVDWNRVELTGDVSALSVAAYER